MENSLTNLSPDNTPLWVISARHFIGTGDHSFINDAIDQCDDSAIKAFLLMIAGSQEREGHLPDPEKFQTLANNILEILVEESRIGEAGIIELLVRRSTILVTNLNIHARAAMSDEAQNIINFTFNRGIQLSQDIHFSECEAFFIKALGDYELILGNWDAAYGAHSRSFVLYSEILIQLLNSTESSRQLQVTYYRVCLEVSLISAISSGKAGHKNLSINILDNTFDLYRRLGLIGGNSREIALSTSSAFNKFARMRYFRAASLLGDLALKMFKDLYESDTGLQQIYDLALCYCEVGQFYAILGNEQKSLPLCAEGVRLFKELVDEHPWFYKCPLGLAYGSLANAYRRADQSAQALSCFKQSVIWVRRASEHLEDPNRLQSLGYLIDALNNYGSACRDAGNTEQALEVYEEALTVLNDLQVNAPYIHSHMEWMIYANLCLLLNTKNRFDEAWKFCERAIAIIESEKIPDNEIWLEKGLATNLYVYMFERYLGIEEKALAFQCLMTLRTAGRGLFNEEKAVGTLKDILQKITLLSHNQSKNITILCPQTLTNSGMMMAILRSDVDSIEFVDCNAFVEPALDLRKQIFLSESSKNTDQNYSANCTAASERAWSFLPDLIQNLLASTDGRQTLICGDDNWMSFPWEALKFGSDGLDFLGLQYPLTRWHSLDASSLSSIADETIDSYISESAVVCPWNATSIKLERARREAVLISKLLTEYAKPTLVQSIFLGENATIQAISAIIAKMPNIIHYAGHGNVSNGEEVLILYDEEQPALFGSREIDASFLQSDDGIEQSHQGRLIVLNCCYGGKVRSFGGHREDIASAFLRWGVSSVVASATPLFDESAGIFGVSLHCQFMKEEENISDIVLRSRRIVARCMQALGQESWATWCTIVYHGNPFLTYRRKERHPSDEKIEENVVRNIAEILANVVTLEQNQQLIVMQKFEEVLRDELDNIKEKNNVLSRK